MKAVYKIVGRVVVAGTGIFLATGSVLGFLAFLRTSELSEKVTYLHEVLGQVIQQMTR